MSRITRDNLQLEILRDISADVQESDFVPYACLYDPNTILTKNGELLQVIKITGFTYESLSDVDADLRKVIRNAVGKSIRGNSYAIWFHTLRRKQRLSPDGDYPDPFSAMLNNAWKQRNSWDRKFINELYITIVREGQSADITSVKGFWEGLVPAVDRKIRNSYLDKIAVELDETVQLMMGHLKEFGAKRLSIVKRDGVYHGEHLEFLEKLINLEERPMPIDEVDLSHYLTSGEVTFAYNAMEVRTAEGLRRYGAMLTIKEYKEASLYRIDRFLQLPCEFIITQCVDFVNARKALASYQDQKYYLQVSGSSDLADESELSLLLSSNRNLATDYGEQQTMIFIIGENIRELEGSIKMVRESLNEVGLVTIREDIKFEDCYWSQLPANFEFIMRNNYTSTSHLAGFVNIQNYPGGNAAGCPWGKPVTLFYTAAGTPYFFNFHLGDNGHTTVIGPPASGKSVLIHFLLAEARKYRNRLFYLDVRGYGRSFIQAIGGEYFDLAQSGASHHIAPLSLPDTKPNQEFLALWMTTLLDPTGKSVNDTLLQFFRGVVAKLYQSSPQERTLAKVAELVGQQDPMLAERFRRWHSGGEYAAYFDYTTEAIEPKSGVIAFNLHSLSEKPELLVPVVSYLMHRITMTLDGTPSIIVLDEAWRLLNNPMFAPRVRGWMEYLSSKNALAIFATEQVEESASCAFASDIMAQSATQIFLPNDDPHDVYSDVFQLDDDEFAYLEAMNVEYRHFMLKRGTETVIAELNLGGMDQLLDVLSGAHEASRQEEAAAAEAPMSGMDLPYLYKQEP